MQNFQHARGVCDTKPPKIYNTRTVVLNLATSRNAILSTSYFREVILGVLEVLYSCRAVWKYFSLVILGEQEAY